MKNKILKSTLLICIIFSLSAVTLVNSSAAGLPGFSGSGILSNILGKNSQSNSGVNIFGNILNQNSKSGCGSNILGNCTNQNSHKNCNSNVLGNILNQNSSKNCGPNIIGNILNRNSSGNCISEILYGNCQTPSSCGSGGQETPSNPAKIEIPETSLSIVKGETKTVQVSVTNAINLNVKSSNSCVTAAIGSVLGNGKATLSVTGICAGDAIVTVYSSNNTNVSDTITVTVKNDTSVTNPVIPNLTFAEEVLKYVNEARKENGLSKLALNETLCAAADIRALEIKTSFSHTRPNGSSCFTTLGEVGFNYRSAGENIASGYQNAKSVVNAWLNSPGHRANILSTKFTYMGLGKNGTYWAQLFAS